MANTRKCTTGLLIAMVIGPHANGQSVDTGMLEQRMRDACPGIWEDVRSQIDPSALLDGVWNGNIADKDAFKAFLAAAMGAEAPTEAELESMASDASTVASECAAQRIALLDGLLARIPNDALVAMNSVMDQLNVTAEAVERGGWNIGDLRLTGQPEPSPGWIFMSGQTIGKTDSGALLTGDVLEELFELAKHWFPNTGSESWTDGDVVTLPDMRGRTIVGTNAMGGVPANTLSDTAANHVGGTFGAAEHQLTVGQMPTHTHSMGSAGGHTHSYTYREHESGVDGGSGATAWKGNQSRSTNNRGAHTHSLNATGGSQPHNLVQPSLVFNIEMKFAAYGDGDLTINPPPPGSEPSVAGASCKTILDIAPESTDGVYWLDVNGGDTADAFQAYCDMTSGSGGWTMVVAQFEEDPVTNWNEGIQPDYDPTLNGARGFAFNTSQLPAHNEIAFGKDLIATSVDYVDFVYSTGDIAKQVLVGKKTGKSYNIHRNTNYTFQYCDPDSSFWTVTDPNWTNGLTFDEPGLFKFAWCFTPSPDVAHSRGYAMLQYLEPSSESFAWTVWVR